MTGADVKRQVMKRFKPWQYISDVCDCEDCAAAAAFAPCVVLTREEAGAAWQTFSEVVESAYPAADVPLVVQAALDLLTPDEADDDRR